MSEPAGDSFSRMFFSAMILRIGLTLGAMTLSYGGAALGGTADAPWASFLGALAGLALGVVLVVLLLRRTVNSADGPHRDSTRSVT